MKKSIILFLTLLLVINILGGCSPAKKNSGIKIDETNTKWEIFAPITYVTPSEEIDYWAYPKIDNSKRTEDQPFFPQSGFNGSMLFSFNHITGEWASPFTVDLAQDAQLCDVIYDENNSCFYLEYASVLEEDESRRYECYIQKVFLDGTLQWTSVLGKCKFMAIVLEPKTDDVLILVNNVDSSEFLTLNSDTGEIRKKDLGSSIEKEVTTNQNGIYGFLTNYDTSSTTVSHFDWNGNVGWTSSLEGCNFDYICASDDDVFISSEIYPYIIQLDAYTGTLKNKIALPNLGFQTLYIDCTVVGDYLFTACTAYSGSSLKSGLIQCDLKSNRKPFFAKKLNDFSCSVFEEYDEKGRAFFRSIETDEMIIYTISQVDESDTN